MYNLLVVDDKDVFCRMIKRMPYFNTNKDKFHIKRIAKNGVEALEILNYESIDIVLTDIRMPLMNGIELLKEINKNKLCKCTILLSEYSEFSYAREGIINGAFDYIVKPVNNDNLKETFDRAYDYLKSFVDKSSVLHNTTIKLANNLIEEESLFTLSLNAVKDFVDKNSATAEERILLLNGILDKLGYQIAVNYEYSNKYIPIDKICKISAEIKSLKDLDCIFLSKILFLRKELLKLSVSVSCPNVQKICNYIILNIDCDSVNLQSISEKFFINKKYLSTLFKKETGTRFTDFVNYFKIEHAKMLLSSSDLKIYNVAEKLGFTDTEYFSRIFKRQTGMTPRSFNWTDYS